MPGVRERLGAELFRRVAGPDGPRHRERIHGTPGPRWFPADSAIARVHGDAVDVRGRHPGGAAPDDAPGGDDRGGRALRLPRRHVGPAGPHQPLPRRHHVRHRAARRAGRRGGAQHPRARRSARCPTGRRTPPPTRTCCVGARGRGRQLPARPPGLRRRAAGPGRAATTTSPRPRSSPASSASSTRRRRRPSWPPRSPTFRPELAATPQAREAVSFLVWHPDLPWAARPAYGALVAAAIGLMPVWTRRPLRLPWLPISERTVVRALGSAATGTIRWALTPPREPIGRTETAPA